METRNHYEKAFAQWLKEREIEHISLDDSKRNAFGRISIKSFDFLVCQRNKKVVVEVKGRTFKGESLLGLKGLQCWVTEDDVRSLGKWQNIFIDCECVFIFSYKLDNYHVDTAGIEPIDSQASRYVFFAVKLLDYVKFMKVRSPKWKTVTLSADDFRRYSLNADDYFQ